jgi:hypothetical protein
VGKIKGLAIRFKAKRTNLGQAGVALVQHIMFYSQRF